MPTASWHHREAYRTLRLALPSIRRYDVSPHLSEDWQCLGPVDLPGHASPIPVSLSRFSFLSPWYNCVEESC